MAPEKGLIGSGPMKPIKLPLGFSCLGEHVPVALASLTLQLRLKVYLRPPSQCPNLSPSCCNPLVSLLLAFGLGKRAHEDLNTSPEVDTGKLVHAEGERDAGMHV